MTDDELNRFEGAARAGVILTPSATIAFVAEMRRLKAAKLTPEEFQNLCHNLHAGKTPVTREQFETGCTVFQEILFGPKVVQPHPLEARVRELEHSNRTLSEGSVLVQRDNESLRKRVAELEILARFILDQDAYQSGIVPVWITERAAAVLKREGTK